MWSNGLYRFHHISDESLARLTAGELGSLEGFRVRKHLEKCWRCRAHREALERSALQLSEYRNRVVEGIPSNPMRRATFVAALRKRAEAALPMRGPSHPIFTALERAGASRSPVLVSVCIVVSFVALLLWVWQRPAVAVNAAQLLNRAEASDLAILHGKPGVVYQKVRITTPGFIVEREIYRDAQGKRRLRMETADKGKLAPIEAVMSKAIVDMGNPLSAASYRVWHDSEDSRTDTVSSGGDGLLMLRTEVRDGVVRQEELTVRASDFHPVRRTIETVANGTIEIAELNYALLDWSSVNASLFEAPVSPRPILPILPLALPSPLTLDNAELAARIVLNRLHADEGEQIDIKRTGPTIEVSGIVDTEARKQELNSALELLPHVKPGVMSVSDLLRREASHASGSIEVQSMDAPDSPLTTYLEKLGAKQSVLSDASRQLLDAELRVRSSANELSGLETRFPAREGTAVSREIDELTQSYSRHLEDGLAMEIYTLRSLGFDPPPTTADAVPASDLGGEVARNNALCLELIAGDEGTGRPVAEVVPEIYASIERIRAALARRARAGPNLSKNR